MIPPVYATLVAAPAVTAITTRIYQDRAAPDAVAPYIVWGLLAAVPERVLKRRPPADKDSLSIDVYARDEAEREALTAAARDALEPHGTVQTIQSLGQEVDTGLWRMTFDIDWFYHR